MRWVNLLDGWLANFDFTSAFQITVLVLVLSKIFTLQFYEQLDHLVERVPLKYGWFRRAATMVESIAWLWMVVYFYEGHAAPSPQVTFLAMASLANVSARFVIVYLDWCRAARLGREVARLSDALPAIRRSGAASTK